LRSSSAWASTRWKHESSYMAKKHTNRQQKLRRHSQEDVLNIMGLETHNEMDAIERLKAKGVIVLEPQTLGQIAAGFCDSGSLPGAA
jgi:RIO-like serine/threonine protein kinase